MQAVCTLHLTIACLLLQIQLTLTLRIFFALFYCLKLHRDVVPAAPSKPVPIASSPPTVALSSIAAARRAQFHDYIDDTPAVPLYERHTHAPAAADRRGVSSVLSVRDLSDPAWLSSMDKLDQALWSMADNGYCDVYEARRIIGA